MNRRITSIILLFITALQLHAVTVTTHAGHLASVVSDSSITQLTIKGTIDARDFKFITDALENLKTLDLSEAYIVAYNSTLDDQLIAGVYSYPAKTLPYCALTGMVSLTSLTLPSNLIAIDYGALAGCSKLASIELPPLKSIGDDAFNSCSSLKTISIHKYLTYLGNSAFAHCTALTEVRLNPNEPLVIGDNAFADCTSLTKVVLGPNVTKIGDGAFNGCTALKQFYFSDESKLEDIGDKAFYNSNIEQIDFGRTPLLKHLGAWALARTKLTKLNIPAHIKSLDEGTLFYNNSLTSLELPKTLSYLPDYMLAGCEHLNGAPFMTQNMGNIGDYALYNQSQHTSISIPYKVHYLGSHAMAGMTGLTEITSEPIKVPELGDDVWHGINQSQVKLNVSSESIDDYRAAEQWQNFLIALAQLRGDVNSDGFVNTLDATAERLYIVNGNSQGINTSLTDVNGDDRINVGDIVSIYNIINGNVPVNKPHRGYFDETIEGNGKKNSLKSVDLGIMLDNPNRNYTAFQFSITTPSYITIDDVTLSDRCLGHEIYFNQYEPDKYTIVGFSPAGDDIEGQSGEIFTLHISSTKAIAINETINLDEILFADNLENVYKRNGIVINILGISAIDNITVDDSDRPVDVYNTQGQLMRRNAAPSTATQGLPAGIYIVGGKKVIVR